MTDHLSALLLCPTETAVENLRRESVAKGIHLVSDVIYDALLDGVEIARRTATIHDLLAIETQRYNLGQCIERRRPISLRGLRAL